VKAPFKSLHPAAVVGVSGLLVLGGVAYAEDSPLSLTMAEYLTHDSNFSRDEQKQSETVKSTALLLSLDKSYGRQTYSANAKWVAQRYTHYKNLLNNDSKDLSGTFSTGIASNWTLTTGGNYSQNLNPIQENNVLVSRVVKNIRTYRDGNASLQYGNGGRWAIVGSYDANRMGYSESAYQYQNANQNSSGLKALYYSSDLLYFGLGSRLVRTHYPQRASLETITDHNIDLTANWRLTGLSDFGAVLSRRDSRYASDDTRHIRGWTGDLNWQYTPHGLMSYGLGVSRTTGADRYKDTYFIDSAVVGQNNIAYNNVTNSYRASANLQATAKLVFGFTYSINQYRIDNSQDGYVLSTDLTSSKQYNSIYHSAALSATYVPVRSVKLACSVHKYSQTKDLYRPLFDGRSVDCNASFTID
jgi:hypothetical protein